MVIMASGIARGRVRMTTTETESRNMVAIHKPKRGILWLYAATLHATSTVKFFAVVCARSVERRYQTVPELKFFCFISVI